MCTNEVSAPPCLKLGTLQTLDLPVSPCCGWDILGLLVPWRNNSCPQRVLDCAAAKENRTNYKSFVCLWLQDKSVVISIPLI